ncbi:unnamed protein product [Arctia plantaginis]|uniref:Uncharacterized protein n=1 Tax=Arctia plantaginis TaxID=874455 RepID=A0A8S0YVR4_ARCPL|nr:unnamed protein product [Arctia plantaginis]
MGNTGDRSPTGRRRCFKRWWYTGEVSTQRWCKLPAPKRPGTQVIGLRRDAGGASSGGGIQGRCQRSDGVSFQHQNDQEHR